MMNGNLMLKLLDKKYAVCSLDKDEVIPQNLIEGDFFSFTKTEDELSIVCLEENITENIKYEGGWRVLKIEGPLDFSLVGILSKISSLMAGSNISIFAISTYDTDYILIKESNINRAIEVLRKNNYNII